MTEDSDPWGAGQGAWWTLSLHYKHFRLPRVEELARDCCQLLGFQGSLPALLDHLLERYRSSVGGGRGCELLVVIGYVLLGAGGRGCVKERERVCGEVGESVE